MKRKTDWPANLWAMAIGATIGASVWATWPFMPHVLRRDINALKGQKLAVVGPEFKQEQANQRMMISDLAKRQKVQEDRLTKHERADTAKAVIARGGLPEAFREVER
jgi:hypothetical protein